MTTPEQQLADRARADEWIASWNAKQVRDYDEQVAKREELLRDDGLEHLREWEAQDAFSEHMRLRFPLGTFFDSIKVDYDGDWRPSLKQLMQVAETGKDLFYAAIGHPDATEEFLDEASEQWGPLVDTALQEMSESIERRDPVTGKFTIHVWPPERTA
jgi:hypothetical protein